MSVYSHPAITYHSSSSWRFLFGVPGDDERCAETFSTSNYSQQSLFTLMPVASFGAFFGTSFGAKRGSANWTLLFLFSYMCDDYK